jgi:hypothetical protein
LLEPLPEPLLPELPEPREPLPEVVPVLEPGVIVLEVEEPVPGEPEEPEEPVLGKFELVLPGVEDELVPGDMLEPEPVLPEDPDVVSEVPLLGVVELDPEVPSLIEPVELPEPLDPEVPYVSELPLPDDPPLIPEEPEEPEPDEPLLDASFVVVVVVVVVAPGPPDAPPDAPLDALLGDPLEAASFWASVVVVVVVCCAKLAPAVPSTARMIARGNFFMLAPCNERFRTVRKHRNSSSRLDMFCLSGSLFLFTLSDIPDEAPHCGAETGGIGWSQSGQPADAWTCGSVPTSKDSVPWRISA